MGKARAKAILQQSAGFIREYSRRSIVELKELGSRLKAKKGNTKFRLPFKRGSKPESTGCTEDVDVAADQSQVVPEKRQDLSAESPRALDTQEKEQEIGSTGNPQKAGKSKIKDFWMKKKGLDKASLDEALSRHLDLVQHMLIDHFQKQQIVGDEHYKQKLRGIPEDACRDSPVGGFLPTSDPELVLSPASLCITESDANWESTKEWALDQHLKVVKDMVTGLLNEYLRQTQRMLDEHAQQTQRSLVAHIQQWESSRIADHLEQVDKSVEVLNKSLLKGPRVIAKTYKDANGENGFQVFYGPPSAPQAEPPQNHYRPRPQGTKINRPSTAPVQRRPASGRPASARPERWKPEDYGFDELQRPHMSEMPGVPHTPVTSTGELESPRLQSPDPYIWE